MRLLFPTVLLLLLYSGALLAQVSPVGDSLYNELPAEIEQLIEDQLAAEGGEGEDFDLNFAFANLEEYRRRPLDINKATYEQLAALPFFSEVQISEILDYRQKMNGFLNAYELQVIPSLDMERLRAALPFIRVGGGIDDLQVPIGQMLRESERDLFVRWNRFLEPARGFTEGKFLGDANQYFVRFKQRYSNKMSFGFTAEKDPGEQFFTGANAKRGFDFLSGHIYARDINRTLKAVALGDFTVNFGQGLILFTGFGAGKSSLVTNIRRSGRTLRPYSSVNEALFMRGGAVTLGFGERLELTAFGSRRGRSGSLLAIDTTNLDDLDDIPLAEVSSLRLDGLHRTEAEIENREAVTQTSVGGALIYQLPNNRGKIGLNVLNESLDRGLNIRNQVYNRFFFRGTQLTNMSIDYSYRWKNLTFFGEAAMSDNGGQAHLHGLLAGLDRYVNLALVYRNYGRDYQALNARPFGETNGGRNEEGLYFGLEVNPAKNWRIAAFYDVFRFHWLRFNVDAPSSGSEWRFRLTYWQKRKLETYLELRNERKGVGFNQFEDPAIDAVLDRDRFQARLHFAYKVNSAFEWRNRLDWGFTDTDINERLYGFTIYQDFIYRPIGVPISFTSRIAFFNTDGYDVRFYNFENGLLYNFRIPAYYGRGSRMYLNVRYKGIRNVTLEARIAQTYFADREVISSGNQAINQPQRTEVGAQMKLSF